MSKPRDFAFSALVMTNATAPSASIGHSSACKGSATIFDANTFSTVNGLPRYMAFGLSCAHLRRVTQNEAISSALDWVACM